MSPYGMQKRPPVVVVMGHVDHGKTTLLDYIKKTNIAAKEAGGITQSIGAYEIKHHSTHSEKNEKITFIDTPGHEAFFHMRERGTRAADIALLVVAADEGVKTQTKEAFKMITETKTTCVVVISRIDKNNADIARVQGQLAQEGIALEGMGGHISWKAVSAKTGEGVNELLDLILLATELEGLSYNPENPARGFVLESQRDNRVGIIVSAIVQDGTIRVGDDIEIDGVISRIKSLEDFLGHRITSAEPSAPIALMGCAEIPSPGSIFFIAGHGPDIKEDDHTNVNEVENNQNVVDETKNAVNLILKASDSGSLDALVGVIQALPLPEHNQFVFVETSVGDIADGDIKHAVSTGSVIIGFNVKISKSAENVIKAQAKEKQPKVFTSKIIYELIKELEEWVVKHKNTSVVGDLEILAVFGKKGGNKNIVGGKVIEGEITNNTSYVIKHGDREVGTGKIINLQQSKKDVSAVGIDNECGMLITTDVDIRVGDHLVRTT